MRPTIMAMIFSTGVVSAGTVSMYSPSRITVTRSAMRFELVHLVRDVDDADAPAFSRRMMREELVDLGIVQRRGRLRP